jgi:hypothetical protein
VQEDLPIGGFFGPKKQLEKCGFTRAAGSGHKNEFAGVNLQTNIGKSS